MDEEHKSNFSLKIYYDSKLNKLAVLKARPDCSLYILVTDMIAGTSKFIETGLYIEGNVLNRIDDTLSGVGFDRDPLQYVPRLFNICPAFNDHFLWQDDFEHIINLTGKIKTFRIAYSIASFEADFTNDRFLLEVPLTENTVNINTLDTAEQRLMLIYNYAGDVILSVKSLNTFFPEARWQNVSSFFGEDVLVYFEDNAHCNYLYIADTKHHTTSKIKLYDGDEMYYEYLDDAKFAKEHNLVAYVCDAPTNGYTGFRVLKLDAENLFLNPVFQVDKLDHSSLHPDQIREGYVFRAIAINTPGTMAAVLHSTHIQKDYISTGVYDIYIYNIPLKDASPLIIKTGHIYELCPEKIHFITEHLVMVVFADVFSFYSISTLSFIKSVPYEMLQAYHVSENYLFYIDKNKLYAVFVEGCNVTRLNVF